MKNTPRTIAIIGALLVTAAGYGATRAAAVNIVVTEQKSAKVVYRGATDARGGFKTGSLAPGSYTLEFRSSTRALTTEQMSIALGGIKGDAKRAPLADGGLAMHVQVAARSPIIGTVSAKQASAPVAYEKVRANVKIMNGKRYVWVPAEIGSNMGGKWVEEGAEGSTLPNAQRRRADHETLRTMQDMAGKMPPPEGIRGGGQ